MYLFLCCVPTNTYSKNMGPKEEYEKKNSGEKWKNMKCKGVAHDLKQKLEVQTSLWDARTPRMFSCTLTLH